jgi:RNA polymerase sigma factor (sigma-70 family)
MADMRLNLLGAKNGDKEAENRIFEYLLVRFTFLAKQRVKEGDAEDIAQEACITVLDKYRNIDDSVNFEAWAYNILRNKIGNYLRVKDIRSKADAKKKLDAKMNHSVPSQLNIDIRRTLLKCLRRLYRINHRYARVLNLAHQGYSAREICDRLDITTNNCYVILSRGRKMLDACLKNGGLNHEQ